MQYIAFLRGINVGGNKKVAMEKLAQYAAELGYTYVRTYINSGNVLFESSKKDTDAIVHEMEQMIEKRFGFSSAVVVRTARNIKDLAAAIPKAWENNTTQKTDILFLHTDFAHKKSLALIPATSVDTLMYHDGAIVWHIDRTNYNKSGMNTFIGTQLYKHMTARNINTVRKLALMV